MAYMRAVESARPDALFHDPFALGLAGSLGESIANQIGGIDLVAGSIAVRTAVLDRLITTMVVQNGIDLVLNIGSGLDSRPWRLTLPDEVHWVDVDLPALVAHKAEVLSGERPLCRYSAFAADILHPGQRAAVIAAHRDAKRMMVVTEGLLVYLHPNQVEALARDLHRQTTCQWWLTDLVGPRALHVLNEIWAPRLRAATFQFGMPNSVDYFGRLGWREEAFHSAQEEARRLKRAPRQPWLVRLFQHLAADSFREEIRRAAGVAALAREETN